ncbi:MAG: hypothetical protein VKM01_08680 [Cyanobacteriota bacterium]|nr:hypothetical protein [Cyanobacteriota bacterium]
MECRNRWTCLAGSTFAFVLVSPVAVSQVNAVVLAGWNFDQLSSGTINIGSNLNPNISNNLGVSSGTLSGRHLLPATVWSSPAGNGGGRSLAATSWSLQTNFLGLNPTGDYFQLQVNTLLHKNIVLKWDQIRASGFVAGPSSFKLAYSNDNLTYTGFATYTVGTSWSSFSQTLSTITGLNNQPFVYFRLIGTPAIVSLGASRIDNVSIEADPVPTPLPIAGAAFAFSCVSHLRRKSHILRASTLKLPS